MPKNKRRSMLWKKRIEKLEQSKRNEGEEELKSLKAKVRGLCMQTEPSVPLILVLVEELATTARRMNSDDAAVFEELARQANCNKEKLDIPSFCLSALGDWGGGSYRCGRKSIIKSVECKVRVW